MRKLFFRAIALSLMFATAAGAAPLAALASNAGPVGP
jgi:hypothetical protein